MTERIALVTGAGSGVGRASAVALMQAGWTVALVGRRADALEAAAAAGTDGRSMVLPTDVSQPAAVDAAFAAVEREYGRLDLLFNNAGMGTPAKPIDEISVEQWLAAVSVNLTGVVPVCPQRVCDDAAADAGRRADHQQWIDLRPCAASGLRRLHRHQARDHRPHQIAVAGRTPVQHRLQPDRHR